MVLKVLFGGASGDLGNVADLGGLGNDTVYVGYESLSHSYSISTYRGNDLIDLRDGNSGNFNVVGAGIGNDRILGGAGADLVADQSGNDRGTLGGGNDLVAIGRGNDVWDGGAGVDLISFAAIRSDTGGSNIATPFGATCDLAIAGVQDFGALGRDVLRNFENVLGTNFNDRFFGNGLANILSGEGGDDFLNGRGGNDGLDAGTGRDTLIGGAGHDVINLTPDSVRDIVRYTSITDSGAGSDTAFVDLIRFFDGGTAATDDRIDLRPIDARPGVGGNDVFLFRGYAGAFSSGRGEIRLEVVGSDTLVHVDIDGDQQSEMNFLVQGVTALVAADFLL
jgi:Ca2+-binding RTX toxin-like protein